MKIYSFVQQQFETGEPIKLSVIYTNAIDDVYDENIHTHGLDSFKHSIRGIVNKLVKEGKIKRIGRGLYQKN